MASSMPCAFDNTEQSLTASRLMVRSTTIMRSSAMTSSSLLSEEEVVSDPGSIVRFITSLNTDLSFKVHGGETISEVKEELMRSHSKAIPRFGEIKINDIKLKCRNCVHSLEDFMPMRIILNKRELVLNLYVDASSSVEYHEEQLVHNWSDSEEDSPCGKGAIGQEESGDLHTCSICLQDLGDKEDCNAREVANSLSPRETDDKEKSLEGLPKNPLIATEPAVVTDAEKINGTQQSISEHGDKKRKKPTPKKILSRKKDRKGKRHMPKQVWNSMPSFESRTKPNEENFPTG